MLHNPNPLTAEHLAVIDPIEQDGSPTEVVITAEHLPILDALEGNDPIEPLTQGGRNNVADLLEGAGDSPSA